MERQYPDSTMIESFIYDENSSTLEINFKKNGQVWQYYDVPENVYFEMESASSAGKFFNSDIKNQYSESRIG